MKRIFACLLTLWAGTLFLTHTATVHQSLAGASHEGSLGGILVGLALCFPLVGVFVLLRAFGRWQRGFHRQMRTDGLAFRRVQP